MVDQLLIARSFSTVSCGLLLGATSWAGLATMPSIIAAQTSTHAKLSVFNGLIDKAGILLPPIFISTVAALGYLSYNTLGNVRTSYAIAASSLALAMGLQVVIVPKNKEMQRRLQAGEASKDDSGVEGEKLVGEVLYWNWGRVILSAVAFGAVLYATETYSTLGQAGQALNRARPSLAAQKLEYGLE